MVLKLLKYEYLIAQEWMRCDALSIWLDRADYKQKGLMIAYNNRHQIQPNNTYLHYEFLDEETGEVFEYNCSIPMNKVLVKHNYYPPIIKNAMVKFKFENL